MSALEKISTGSSLMKSKNTMSGQAGKGLVMMGGGALLLPVVAAIIPFIGLMPVAIVAIILGVMLWE